MERRAKVELFEQIRREYEFGVGTIKGVAKKLGVHRRMVRQAVKDALPPERKIPIREKPKIDQVRAFIDEILEQDRRVPRKQRHTTTRIYKRIEKELKIEIGRSTVCRYVKKRKEELGIGRVEVFIPQSYKAGIEAQVDWYEAIVEMDGEQKKLQFFSMRSMFSGGAFHRAYLRATQQAFFEAHELAFYYFGGVFQQLRYDNLASAVKKILRGYTREENARFIAFRSHWKFEAQFCNPKKGNEKGGVEGEVGYFRRNHLVPIPSAKDFGDLNRQLLTACLEDHNRIIGERKQSVGAGMLVEQEHFLPLAAEGFELAENCFPIVDKKGRVRVRNNWYSAPLKPGTKVRVRVLPDIIEVLAEGNLVASHQRSYQREEQVLNLEHYLDVLEHKPGAFAASKPLEQWRAAGRWPDSFDLIWRNFQQRLGKQDGTRQMIELLQLGKRQGWDKLRGAVEKALEMGSTDPSAVAYLMMTDSLLHKRVELLDVGELARYERPVPQMSDYDQLLEVNR